MKTHAKCTVYKRCLHTGYSLKFSYYYWLAKGSISFLTSKTKVQYISDGQLIKSIRHFIIWKVLGAYAQSG